jgi:pSer/pThr/pTyr-binding forkhead associated (FHA) protein
MAKMILSMDGLVLKEIPLNKERLSIGRKPQNDIQIDNLAISGEHAVVVTILADSFLEDLNSTNGTLVNGQPIKKHFLRNNDIIELGKYKLKYMSDLQAVPLPAILKKMLPFAPARFACQLSCNWRRPKTSVAPALAWHPSPNRRYPARPRPFSCSTGPTQARSWI